MLVERLDEMRLTLKDEKQIARLLQVSMKAEYDGRSYYQNRFHCRLVIRENSEIVGHLGLAFRAIRLGEVIINCIGIGDVAVDPKHRGKGFGSLLIEEMIKEGRLTRAEFALLFGQRALYAATGFRKAANRLTSTQMIGAQTGETKSAPHDYFMVMALGERSWDETQTVDLSGYPF